MEISLADERALLLKEQLTLEQAEGRAWSNKIDAFGRIAKMGSLLQRPKDDDFELIYKEHRVEPFWHVVCDARYVYERRREFPLEISGPEVEKVTIEDKEYGVTNGRLILHGLEYCREEPHKTVFVDGYSNQPVPELAGYLDYPANEVPTDYMEELTEKGIIVVPPQVRASAVVREVLIGMLRTVKADRILEDSVNIQTVDLYYRPVYAFQYRWRSRDKEAILEYDGLTGQLQTGGKTFQQYMGKLMDPEFLFDVGADTIDLLVPGGGIAVKLARKGIDAARKK
ncbi:MAG: hypothetical protein KC421_01650 [Anaerolineales bacterium]|nr:hypothetical protein [Anaerolineales bacterium]